MKTRLINKPQLFLLHFGGGNCYSYQFLKEDLIKAFDFIPLELPGRGKRMKEKLIQDNEFAIEDYLEQVKGLRNDQPFLIYGHSMGATMGLYISKRLEMIGDPPKALVVSGNSGPGTGENKQRHLMSDTELKQDLEELGGIPNEVFENDELFDFFSPILRADFEVMEKIKDEKEECVINTPIYAVMGDAEESALDIENWKRFTSKEFNFRILPGNHFFIHDNSKELVDIIIEQDGRNLVL